MIKKILGSCELWGEVNRVDSISSIAPHKECLYLLIIGVLEILFNYQLLKYEGIFGAFLLLLVNIMIALKITKANKLFLEDLNEGSVKILFKCCIVFLFRLMNIVSIGFLIHYYHNKDILFTWIIISLLWILEIYLSLVLQKNVGLLSIVFIFIIGFSLVFSKFWGAVVLYLGYYFVNWLSSEDSLFYLSKDNKIKFKIDNVVKLRWKKQKSKALFLLISVNISFAIKEVIPQNIKDNILERLFNMLSMSRGKLDTMIVISLLIFATSGLIYLGISYIVGNDKSKIYIIKKQHEIIEKSKNKRRHVSKTKIRINSRVAQRVMKKRLNSKQERYLK